MRTHTHNTPLILTTPNFTIERNGQGDYTLRRHWDGAAVTLRGQAAGSFYEEVCKCSMGALERCIEVYAGAMQ